jgi:hypothetical protein
MRVLVLCLVLFCGLIIFLASGYKEVEQRTNIEFVRELYDKVNRTLPSVVSAKEHERIIRERLECYAVDTDYARRIRECNNVYAKAIVKQARNALTSRPDMGKFVLNLNMCPVMRNMCIGIAGNDSEQCITFERQCIDYTLDSFWRGASQYTQQQYRPE